MTSTGSAAIELPLSGVRVLDLSRVIAGPFCAALLGDMGADVIKVEDTSTGDESRSWPPHKSGESAAFLVNNRNKRGISLDLKSADGAAVLRRLVETADVLVENFRAGTMEKFGLGYDELARINPRLVYCSVSAFGRTGPRQNQAGYEAMMQAFSGIMSMTGEADGAPVRCGVSFIDGTTGVFCALGIVTALLHRKVTGQGQRVEGSLLTTAVSLMNFQAEGFLLAGQVPQRMGSAHPAIAPYRTFECRDGQWIFIAGANDRVVARLMRALDLESVLDDSRFRTNEARVSNRREVDRIVAEAIAQHDRDPLLKMLHEAGFPAAPVNTVAQALEDPQVAAMGLIQNMKHPALGEVPVVGFPVRFSGMATSLRRHAPMRGEDTQELLISLGYSVSEIASIRERGAVA